MRRAFGQNSRAVGCASLALNDDATLRDASVINSCFASLVRYEFEVQSALFRLVNDALKQGRDSDEVTFKPFRCFVLQQTPCLQIGF